MVERSILLIELESALDKAACALLTLGYPKRNDTARRIVRPWKGYAVKTITHPHFGPHPVRVFAIYVPPNVEVSGG